MLAVAGVVLVISMGWRFSGYLNEAASGRLTQDVLFLIMMYRLPGFLELIVPISFFLSIMLSYGRLYVDSEMVVLEATGMSPFKLIGITLAFSSVIVIATAVVALWLKPAGEAKFEALFIEQRNLSEFDTLAPGRFQSQRTGVRVTYTEAIEDDGELIGVFIAERSEGAAATDLLVVNAERGETQVDASGNRFLVLKNGTRYSGKPGEADYRVIEYEEYGQFIEKKEGSFGQARRTAIPTQTLIEEPSPRNTSELHWRISVVIMVPILALLAVPLSRVNPRQGRFSRLMPGMMLCLLYVGSLSAARSALEDGRLPMSLGLWWIHGAYILIVLMIYNWSSIKLLFSNSGGKHAPA